MFNRVVSKNALAELSLLEHKRGVVLSPYALHLPGGTSLYSTPESWERRRLYCREGVQDRDDTPAHFPVKGFERDLSVKRSRDLEIFAKVALEGDAVICEVMHHLHREFDNQGKRVPSYPKVMHGPEQQAASTSAYN